jgi:hypothetical protein
MMALALGLAQYSNLDHPINNKGSIKETLHYEDITYKINSMHPQYSLNMIDRTIHRRKSLNELTIDKIISAQTGYSEVVDKIYMKANARQESTTIHGIDSTFFDPLAESKSGARGLLQFIEEVWPHYGTPNFDDAFDPEKNFKAGLKLNLWIENHLSQRDPEWNKLSLTEKRKKIAAAHNGGTGSLRRAGYVIGLMKFESQNHACRIDQYYQLYDAEEKIMNAYDSIQIHNK